MLNIVTSLDVLSASSAVSANADLAEVAVLTGAGFVGAGAFAPDGTGAGCGLEQSLPRVKWALSAPDHGYATAGLGGSAGFGAAGSQRPSNQGRSQVLTGAIRRGAAYADSRHFNPMTRIQPVTPGGVGPHPAREPDPV